MNTSQVRCSLSGRQWCVVMLMVAVTPIGVRTGHAAGCAQLIPPAIPCPNAATPGRVDVKDFNFRNPAVRLIDDDELQCALDCLDGDRLPEWALLPGPGGLVPPSAVPGGVVRFAARYAVALTQPMRLPVWSTAPVHVQGSGSVIIMNQAASGVSAVFQRLAPVGGNACDVAWLAENGAGWTFEDLTFVNGAGAQPTSTPPTNFLRGVALDGASDVTVRRCRFEGFDLALDLHDCEGALVENCTFSKSRWRDVVLADGTAHCGDVLDAWAPSSCPDYASCETGPSLIAAAPLATDILPGSNLARVQDSIYVGGGANVQLVVANTIVASDGVVLDGVLSTGERPGRFVITSSPAAAMSSTFVMRECVIASTAAAANYTLMTNLGTAMFVIDNLTLPTFGPDGVIYDVQAANKSTVTVVRDSTLPAGQRFSVGPTQPQGVLPAFSFHSCSGAPSPSSSARWQLGMPRILSIVSADEWRVPEIDPAVGSDVLHLMGYVDAGCAGTAGFALSDGLGNWKRLATE